MDNHPVVYLLRDTEVLEVKWEQLPGKANPEDSFTELSAGCPIKGLALSYWKKNLKEHGGICQPRAICKGDSL